MQIRILKGVATLNSRSFFYEFGKTLYGVDGFMPNMQKSSTATIINGRILNNERQVEQFIKELDYIDLMTIHSPQPWMEVNQSSNRYYTENPV